MNSKRVISTILYGGVLFYLAGAVIHFFGLSIYPWFVSELYSTYHDTLIAISSLAMAVFFFQGARHPENKDLIYAIAFASLLCGPLIIAMGIFVDFDALNAVAKGPQAILEGVAAIALGLILFFLSRKSKS
jgi:hypothetical protein